MLNKFVTCLYTCHNISGTIVQMSEYSMMWKFLLVGWHTLIMCNTIDGRYKNTDSLSFFSLLILLST